MQYFRFAFTAIALITVARCSPRVFEPATAKQALGLDPIPAKFGSGYTNPDSADRVATDAYDLDAADRRASNAYTPDAFERPASNAYTPEAFERPASSSYTPPSNRRPAASTYNPPSNRKPAASGYNPTSNNRQATGPYTSNTNNKPSSSSGYSRTDIDRTYTIYRSSLQSLARELESRSSYQQTSTLDTSRAALKTAQTALATFRTAAKPTPTRCAAVKLIPAGDQEIAVKYLTFVQKTVDEAYAQSIDRDGESAYWNFCLIDDYMGAVEEYIEKDGVYNGKSIGTF